MIYVTHDQVEAMTLADKIVVLNAGHVAQAGSPLELYHHPQNLFVAGFIGSPKMNFIEAEVTAAEDQRLTVKLPTLQTWQLPVAAGNATVGAKVTLGIRPEHLHEGTAEEVQLQGSADVVERLGDVSYTYFHLGDNQQNRLIAATPGSSRAQRGMPITVSAHAAAVHVFDAQGQAFARLDDDPRYRFEADLVAAS